MKEKDSLGWTALHHASFLGHLQIVQLLTDHGAQIDASDLFGLTPLHLASTSRHLPVVIFLLKAGASILMTDLYGRTPNQMTDCDDILSVFNTYLSQPPHSPCPLETTLKMKENWVSIQNINSQSQMHHDLKDLFGVVSNNGSDYDLYREHGPAQRRVNKKCDQPQQQQHILSPNGIIPGRKSLTSMMNGRNNVLTTQYPSWHRMSSVQSMHSSPRAQSLPHPNNSDTNSPQPSHYSPYYTSNNFNSPMARRAIITTAMMGGRGRGYLVHNTQPHDCYCTSPLCLGLVKSPSSYFISQSHGSILYPTEDEKLPLEKPNSLTAIWVKVKKLAKWQIMMIAVRILFCYLLELFFDHLKHLIQTITFNYTLYDALYLFIYEPLRLLLNPLYPLWSPLLKPLKFLISLLKPFHPIIYPICHYINNHLLLIKNFLVIILRFLVLRIQWVMIPTYRLLVEPFSRIMVSIINSLSLLLQPFWIQLTVSLDTVFDITRWLTQTTLIKPIRSLMINLLQPLWSLVRHLVWKISVIPALKVQMRRLIDVSFQAIKPMLNIQGFFAKVFGPFISALKAVLHWFLPISLLRPIEELSRLIFGEVAMSYYYYSPSPSPSSLSPPFQMTPLSSPSLNKSLLYRTNNSPINADSNGLMRPNGHHFVLSSSPTEETALVVIFVFVVVTYGSVLAWGFVFKIIYGLLRYFNSPLHIHLETLLHILKYPNPPDPYPLYANMADWLLPDWLHHQLGILLLLLSILSIVMFKSTRYLVLWGRGKDFNITQPKLVSTEWNQLAQIASNYSQSTGNHSSTTPPSSHLISTKMKYE